MELMWIFFGLFANLTVVSSSNVAEICQPWELNAKRDFVPGRVNCRYTLTSGGEVNYDTCLELAGKWEIPLETFFKLNPDVDRDCTTIKPNTEYCVAGCKFPPMLSNFLPKL
jgi:hypothetical protein